MNGVAVTTRPTPVTAADVAAMTPQERAELYALLLSFRDDLEPLPLHDDSLPVGRPPNEHRRFVVVGGDW